ncbi:MAG: ABC transporter ATP-binding protein [Acidobacteria bacterium]|nr:ABC transporter ATP-binding protein [Acidobacteriota bacterium]
MQNNILTVRNVDKTYRRGVHEVKVLEKVNFHLSQGEFVSLMGPSGSGKTTLLNIVGGLDSPSAGSVIMDGTDIATLGDGDLSSWRNANIGFVFQQYNLIQVLTAYENVEMPLMLFNLSKDERRRRVLTALQIVGLKERANHFPRQMSGGEEQRTAIARALVTDPKLIIADEPTGNLDAAAAANVLDLLQALNAEFKKTILMVTHDPEAALRAHRQMRLHKGALVLDPAQGARA